jgi:RHS repeat-associated protein
VLVTFGANRSYAHALDGGDLVLGETRTYQAVSLARPFSYTYNAAGRLEMTTLPSGRTITQCYDRAGRAKSVTSAKPGGQAQTYMSQASYDAGGGINQALLGNGKWLDWDYNERKQVTSIKLGSAAGVGDVLTLGYSFGTTNNNGNVVSQTITRPSFWATQNYGYDALNRVNSVTEGTESRTFDYTPTGSMWVVGASANFAASSFTPRSSAWFDANNRLVNVGLSISYDAAGNQTGIGGYSNTYNAENRLATSTLNGITTNYVYDGEGRRVKKGAMVMTYDAFGNLAAEYGGTMTEFGTRYLTTDHLGSTRLVTDASGAAKQCRDYLPFGEEIAQGVGGRPSCYAAASKPRLKFTGKERDVETGLDFFLARFYSGTQGRFTSPDKPFAGQSPFDPQTWNLYSYARNNPLKFIDPTGRCSQAAGGYADEGEGLFPGPCSGGKIGEQKAGNNSVTVGVGRDEANLIMLQRIGEGLSTPAPWANVVQHGVEGAMLAKGLWELPGALRGGWSLLRGLSGGSETIPGLFGGVSRAALEAAANGGGETIKVVTSLTQAPASGRGLSVAIGEGAEALAGAARSGGTTYAAQIPKALINLMRGAGLVTESSTQMGGAVATELRFAPNAAEFVTKFFKPVQ